MGKRGISFMVANRWVVTGLILTILLVGILLLVNFARKAEPVSDNRGDWLTESWIAHRGLHDDKTPENTIAAFYGAIEKGCPIELDVTLTKDEQVVVFHDKKLKRLFGVDGDVLDMTYDELAKLEFPGSTERIPLFSEVLKVVDGQVPLLIEIKNEGAVGELERLTYEELKDYNGQYAIQSFNPYSVKWFRTNAPDVLRGQLAGSFIVSDYDVENAGTTRLPWYKKFVLSNMLMNFESRPNFIAYEINNDGYKAFKGLKKLGVPVLGWTVDSQATYQKAKNECDNLIVDTFDLE
jgi:glycerophosphoryl diester phosphodiesterase